MAVALPDDLKAMIDSSRADGSPILWASVDESGQSTIAIYGSTHVQSDHELAIWLRTGGRGFLSRTGKNAKVFGWYRNTNTNVACQIVGEAHRVDGPASRDRVYNESPEAEEDGRGEGRCRGTRRHRPRHCCRLARLTERVERVNLVQARRAPRSDIPSAHEGVGVSRWPSN